MPPPAPWTASSKFTVRPSYLLYCPAKHAELGILLPCSDLVAGAFISSNQVGAADWDLSSRSLRYKSRLLSVVKRAARTTQSRYVSGVYRGLDKALGGELFRRQSLDIALGGELRSPHHIDVTTAIFGYLIWAFWIICCAAGLRNQATHGG